MTQRSLTKRRTAPRTALRVVSVAIALGALASAGGCNVFGIFGVMARTYQETGTHMVPAEYEGLADKNFAVIVSADRTIQGTFPELVTRVTQLVTQRLAVVERTEASGFVPAPAILEFQLTNPSWNSWTYDQIAEEFGVDRLVVIDIYEFRLHEPGNQNLWDGQATARVGVVEADSPIPDDFTFNESVRVSYPDGRGFSKSDFPRRHVFGFLERRLVDRVSWLFYEHEEKIRPDY